MTKNKRSFEYTESIIDLGIEGGVLDMYIYMWLAGLKSQEKRGMLDRIVTGRLKPFNNKISQRRKNRTERVEKMLEILKDRIKYLIERGSTLNNPHIPPDVYTKFPIIKKNYASELRHLIETRK